MSEAPVIRSEELRAHNRHRLLSALRRRGTCSRAELADMTGLSAASVSILSAQLIEEGVIHVDKPTPAGPNAPEPPVDARPEARPTSRSGTASHATDTPSRRGRPQNRLSLSASASAVLTVSLSIDRLNVRLCDYAGHVLSERELGLDTRALSGKQLQSALIVHIDSLFQAAPVTPATISVAFQGVTDNRTGDFLWSPIIRARRVPVRACLTRHFGIPVSVHHDCRLIADALHDQHRHVLGDSFAAVLFSHGVGMGLYLDGSVFSGTRSSGLELGHLLYRVDGALCRCGRQGCIEAYSADYAVARHVQANASKTTVPLGRVPEATLRDIVRRAREGDEEARTAFNEAGRAVGYGLAHVFTLFDPMPVALIGLSDATFSLMQSALHDGVQRVHRPEMDTESVIHYFNDPEPLLQHGLIIDALHAVDRLLADTDRTESAA